MVEILRYKDFSDSYIPIQAKAGRTIKEAVDIKDWGKYIVIVNGVKKNEKHVIQEDDVIIIRMIPRESFDPLDWVFTVMTGGIYAIAKSSYDAYQARKAAEEALSKLKNRTKDDITNIPYIRGATNTIATGKTQPYVIGRHLFTPYIMNGGGNNYKGFHTISGNRGKDSFYNVVLEGGFSKQVLESLSCDDVKVASLFPGDGSPQEGEFFFNSNTEFASQDSYIEIAQDGNAFTHNEFNQKIVEQEVSDELKKADADDYETLYYTLEKNAKSCDICIMFNGLYYMSDEGTKGNRSVAIIPAWSPDYAQRLAEDNHPENATWYGVGDQETADIDFQFDQPVYTDDRFVTYEGVYEYTTDWLPLFWGTWREHIYDATFVGGTDIRGQEGVVYSGYDEQIGIKPVGFNGTRRKYKFVIKATKTVFEPASVTHNYSNTFSYNSTTQLRFNAHKDFAFADHFTYDSENEKNIQRGYPITIRLRCPTNKVSSGTEVAQCYVEWIHSYCYDVDKSASQGTLVDERVVGDEEAAKSTLIGVHIKATLTNEDKIKAINVVTNGLAPIPTKNSVGIWEWNLANKVITSNPASWLIEILTSDTHKASKVSLTDEIDTDTFGDLYDYCENQGIFINKVLTEGEQKAQVLDDILSVCHATLYQNIYGKIAVAIDREIENPIALLNEQNLISFDYEKSVSLEVDGLRCKYIDANSGFQENNFVALYDSSSTLDENSVLREVTLDGITDEIQARRQARYIMASTKLRPLKATAKIGNEGFFFTPYSKLLVQHPSLKIGLGNAVIKNIIVQNDRIVGVDLYEPVDIDFSNPFSVIIQCVGEDYCTPISRTVRKLFPHNLELSDGTNLELSDGTELEIMAGYHPSSYIIDTPLSLSSGEFLELSDGTDLVLRVNKYSPRRIETLYFSTPIPVDSAVIPHRGDVLSYGYELETVSREFIITTIKPNGTDGYTLELYDYDEEIFDFDSAEIPDYQPLITERRPVSGEKPSEVPEVYTTIEKANEIAAGVAQEIAETVATEVVADKTPRYLGKLSDLPATANEGDWFTANGISGKTTGYVYEYVKVIGGYEWQELVSTNSNYDKFMAALPDILSLRTTTDGYFGTVFAQTLVSNNAFIEKLAASIITLRQDSSGNGGIIKSSNYIAGTSGWKIDYEGNAEFTDGTFRGEIEATKGTFAGTIVQGGEFYFVGRIGFTYSGGIVDIDARSKIDGFSIMRINTGRFVLFFPEDYGPEGLIDNFIGWGAPFVVPEYISDLTKNDSTDYTSLGLIGAVDNPYGSNAAYQLHVSTYAWVERPSKNLTGFQLFFTDMNNDAYVDPYKVKLLVFLAKKGGSL